MLTNLKIYKRAASLLGIERHKKHQKNVYKTFEILTYDLKIQITLRILKNVYLFLRNWYPYP